MPIRFLRIALATCTLALAAGCATYYDGSSESQADLARHATTDAAQLQKRWGFMAGLVGRSFVTKGDGGLRMRWVVPGVVMESERYNGDGYSRTLTQYEPANGKLHDVNGVGESEREGVVQADGSVKWSGNWLLDIEETTRTLALFEADWREAPAAQVDKRLVAAAAATAEAQRRQAAELRARAKAEEDDDDGFFGSLMTGLAAASQATNSAYAQQAADRQASQARQMALQQRLQQQQMQQQQAQAASAARAQALQAQQAQQQQQQFAAARAQAQQPPVAGKPAPTAAAATPAQQARPVVAAAPAVRPAAPPTPAVAPPIQLAKAPSPSNCVLREHTRSLRGGGKSEQDARAAVAEFASKGSCSGGAVRDLKCSSTRDVSIDGKGKTHDLGTRTHDCFAVQSCGQQQYCPNSPSSGSAQ